MKSTLKISLYVLALLLYVGGSVGMVMASDRFINNGNGTVSDTQEGMMWLASPMPALNQQEAINYCLDLEYGGFTNWRLPKIRRLLAIIDRSRTEPSVNIDFFDAYGDEWTWSMDAFDRMNKAWFINMDFGTTSYINRWTEGKSFRCSRGAPEVATVSAVATNPSEFFVKTDEGILDTRTNLLWVVSDGVKYTHDEAMALGGRLPTVKELESIINFNAYSPATADAFTDSVLESGYWSSTGWAVYLDVGWTAFVPKWTPLYVMVVYDGGVITEPEPEPEPEPEAPTAGGGILDGAISLGSSVDLFHLKQSETGGDNTINVKSTYDFPIDFAELDTSEVEIVIVLKFQGKTYYTTGTVSPRFHENKKLSTLKAE